MPTKYLLLGAGAIIILVVVLIGYYYIYIRKTPEVYLYSNGNYGYGFQTVDDARAAAINMKGVLASGQQMTAAQSAAANWCWPGWDDAGNVVYPMTTIDADCGNLTVGVNTAASGSTFAANIFGVKPPQTGPGSYPICDHSSGPPVPCVLPFNGSKWSQYSKS